jgi:phosphatidylserine/phosphatidylglycerophosphate/cardiolipin synthase-like enzyme
MVWLLLATGFTGAYTLLFLGRSLHRYIASPPSVAVHFSPKGGCTDAVVRELLAARHEVLVLAYSFTSKPIAQALVDAKLRGVKVDIVLDHSNEKEEYSDLHFFLEQGLVPVIDPHHAIAHNKVMIVDSRTILTGSFNFTNQAEHENAENLLIIKGHPELITSYRKDFAGHKGHARAAEVAAKPRPAAAPAAPATATAPARPAAAPAPAAHAHKQAA